MEASGSQKFMRRNNTKKKMSGERRLLILLKNSLRGSPFIILLSNTSPSGAVLVAIGCACASVCVEIKVWCLSCVCGIWFSCVSSSFCPPGLVCGALSWPFWRLSPRRCCCCRHCQSPSSLSSSSSSPSSPVGHKIK